MRALSSAEVARMRSTQQVVMNTTCTISRASAVADGAGGQTITWSTLAANVPCRVMKAQSDNAQTSEQARAERMSGKAVYAIALPATQDVTPSDRITCGGRTYEVVQVHAGVSVETARSITATEIL